MGIIVTLGLTPLQKEELLKGLKHGKPKAFRDRCQIILLKDEGKASKDVAAIMGISHMKVTIWLRRYRNEGIEGLKTRTTKRGKKLLLDRQHDADLIRRVMAEANYEVEPARQAYLAAGGKQISHQTFRRFVNALSLPTSLQLERKRIKKARQKAIADREKAKARRKLEQEEREARKKVREIKRAENERLKAIKQQKWQEQKSIWALRKQEKEAQKKDHP